MTAFFEEHTALGFFELQSISRGFWMVDSVIKKAPVRVLVAEPTSLGRFVLMFTGDIASVEESYLEGQRQAEGSALRNIFIPSLHSQLPHFLESAWKAGGSRFRKPVSDSVGIVETTSMADAVLSCDSALKMAPVRLSRLHLGAGIGGRGYYVLCGRLEDLQSALEAAVEVLRPTGSLVRTDVIARPDEEAMAHF